MRAYDKIFGEDLHRSLPPGSLKIAIPGLLAAGSHGHAAGYQGKASLTKFNESFSYAPDLLSSHESFGYTTLEIVNFEISLLTSLEYRLKRPTPYCYLSKIKDLLGSQSELQYEEIESVI